jgi:hypothetical protein
MFITNEQDLLKNIFCSVSSNMLNYLLSKKGGSAPTLLLLFFLTIKDDLMIGSPLKEELLGDYSGFFYGLHPARYNTIKNQEERLHNIKPLVLL